MIELIRANDIVLIGFARSLLEDAGIPVLVGSGMGTPGPNDMPDGARFIPKPYEPTTLVRTLRSFIRRAA